MTQCNLVYAEAWGLVVEMIEAKTFKAFIAIWSLLRSERLCADIELSYNGRLIISAITYCFPTGDFEADDYFSKLQRCQYMVCRTIGNIQGAHRSAICTRH
jgi:hypothetical protein